MDFVKDNYVKPTDVDIQFPEKKRNVVYIFLESMEMSYADKSVGGAFDENYIPELTDLALGDNAECFAGNDETLNGAVPMHGATFTSGAMVAQTSGLPAMEEIGNAAGTQSSFYPGATTIGDILGALVGLQSGAHGWFGRGFRRKSTVFFRSRRIQNFRL